MTYKTTTGRLKDFEGGDGLTGKPGAQGLEEQPGGGFPDCLLLIDSRLGSAEPAT